MKNLRSVCIFLLILCLIAPVLSAAAQDAAQASEMATLPTLFLTAEYFDRTKDGRISAEFVLECRYPEDPSGDASGAPGTLITIEPQNGLTLAADTPASLSAGDIPCGGSYRFSMQLQYDEESVEQSDTGPSLFINASSSAIGGCDYYCAFDITPTPRAYLIGINTSPYLLDAYACAQTVSSLSESLSGFYYDGQPLSVSCLTADISDPAAQDIWSMLGTVTGNGADENDITYVYLNSRTTDDSGAPLSGIQTISSGAASAVAYNDIISHLAENVKGRLIIICDGSFGGLAPGSSSAFSLDGEYCNVIGSYFTAHTDTPALYDGMLACSLADAGGVVSVSDFAAQTASGGSAANRYLAETSGTSLNVFFSGQGSNLLFSTDRYYHSGERILAVKEETCTPYTFDALHMYYQYLREVEIRHKGLATLETQNLEYLSRYDDFDDFACLLSDCDAEGILSAAVCDFDSDGALDMITIYPHTTTLTPEDYYGIYLRDDPSYYSDWNPNFFVWDINLYQIENGRVVCTDTLEHISKIINWDSGIICQGSVRLGKSEGRVYIGVTSHYDTGESDNGASYYSYIVSDGKFASHNFLETGFFRCMNGDPNYTVTSPGADQERANIAHYYFNRNSNKVNYEVTESTNLHAIISGAADEVCYEPLVCPDFKFPDVSAESEYYCGLLTSIVQTAVPGATVSVEYTDHAHQYFTITAENQFRMKVECSTEGLPVYIDIRSYSGFDEWKDEFQILYDSIIALAETGLSADEYAALSSYCIKDYETFETADRRVRGQFLPEPMHKDYAILHFYFDLSPASEHYCELLSSIVQSVAPGAAVSIEYTDHEHLQCTITAENYFEVDVICNKDGTPQYIYIESICEAGEWRELLDEFQMLYNSILTLPESGVSADEYAALSGYRVNDYGRFQTADERVRGMFSPEPMFCDYASLYFAFD